ADPRAGAGVPGRAVRGHRRAGGGRHPRAAPGALPPRRHHPAHHARAGDRRPAGHPRGHHLRRADGGPGAGAGAAAAPRAADAGGRVRGAGGGAGLAPRQPVLLRADPGRGAAMSAPLRSPGFVRHLWLLWRLRAQIALNQQRSRALAGALYAASIVPAAGLGASAYALLALPWVARSPVWSAFILNLLCFVTSAVWCTWPILSAGVDDHSELSRYAAFPISRFRLLFASTLASVCEPRILFFFAPVVGASLGFAATHQVAAQPLLPLLMVSYAALNAAWSRFGLHVVLNVLRAHRNAELL